MRVLGSSTLVAQCFGHPDLADILTHAAQGDWQDVVSGCVAFCTKPDDCVWTASRHCCQIQASRLRIVATRGLAHMSFALTFVMPIFLSICRVSTVQACFDPM